jgi:hypothetical protein
MTTGKGKKSEVATWSKNAWGFLKPQHNRSLPLARQEPSNFAVPDPMVFFLSKSLQAACPMQDT